MTAAGGPQSWDADHLKRQLQAMDNFDFEHLIADLWERQGWDAEVEQQSGDAGVDVRATKDVPYSQKALIQAKRYSSDNTLGGPDIQQYAALKHQEANVDKAIVVTTGRFTSSAEDRANDLNVKLIDGDDLIGIIDQLNAYDVVEEYIGVPTSQDSGESTTGATDTDDELYLPPKEREQLNEVIDGDVEDHLLEQQYKATRALEQAQAKVKINPHDATQIGVFNDIIGIDDLDPERKFEQQKTEIAVLSDHVHLDGEGDAFIGDLTEFIHGSAVDAGANENIVAIIERGVLDESWVSGGILAKGHLRNAKQSSPPTQETSSAGPASSTEEASSTPSTPSLPDWGLTRKIESSAAGHNNFHYLAIGGFVLSVTGFFLIGAGPESAFGMLGALMILFMPFVGITGLLLDLGYIRGHDSDWSPSIILGFIGAVVLMWFYFAYYVYKRRKHVGL